ncbi:hypothetical protein K443DRAFT_126056 [Laccaria amethystina LaAM-08-1]|uniref:Unplaced genomic scaffold K443scaffold_410, whole genome shotgun sequence n=1 Tax=Laccaria amethystina LaAM-08-1 TaxID=1095629 RepID=A0A0C9X313_9AGAR|nr:hypothetical protein K443DRAFT_126056 [Laccaria amethystina LaAM-08-1]
MRWTQVPSRFGPSKASHSSFPTPPTFDAALEIVPTASKDVCGEGGGEWSDKYHAFQFGFGFGDKGGEGGKGGAERRGGTANSSAQLCISLLAKSADGIGGVTSTVITIVGPRPTTNAICDAHGVVPYKIGVFANLDCKVDVVCRGRM